MKAMEIIFDRIDEPNAEIKLEGDMREKFVKALEIEQIVKVMRGMEDLRVRAYLSSPDVHYVIGCGDNEYV